VLGDGAGTDIADGFHRVSPVYRIDLYADVPLKLADIGRRISTADHSGAARDPPVH
jgi:hypothetical protein